MLRSAAGMVGFTCVGTGAPGVPVLLCSADGISGRAPPVAGCPGAAERSLSAGFGRGLSSRGGGTPGAVRLPPCAGEVTCCTGLSLPGLLGVLPACAGEAAGLAPGVSTDLPCSVTMGRACLKSCTRRFLRGTGGSLVGGTGLPEVSELSRVGLMWGAPTLILALTNRSF